MAGRVKETFARGAVARTRLEITERDAEASFALYPDLVFTDPALVVEIEVTVWAADRRVLAHTVTTYRGGTDGGKDGRIAKGFPDLPPGARMLAEIRTSRAVRFGATIEDR